MHKKIKLLFYGFIGVLCYPIIFFILRLGLNYIPNLFLWGNTKLIFNLYSISFYRIDVIYFLFGLILTIHGIINLVRITEENHKAQDMKSRKPKQILTTGFYKKARHPMYGTFIIINLGLFFSSRSLWGVFVTIIFCVIQYLNTVIEEKHELIKIFGEDYIKYKKKVSNKIFLPIYKVYIIISIILTVAGLIFMY